MKRNKRVLAMLLTLLLCMGTFLSCMKNPPEESTTDAVRESGTERSTAAETDSHGTESGIGSETDKESDESDTEPEESGSKPEESDTKPEESDSKPVESDTKSGETDTDPEESDIKPGETETAPPHRHAFGKWTIVRATTCTGDGEEERTCSCGERKTRTVPAKGHTEVIDKAVEPSCTETGLTEGEHCSVCGVILVKQNVISTKAHIYVVTVVPPTETEQGYTEHICSACGDFYRDTFTIDCFRGTYIFRK